MEPQEHIVATMVGSCIPLPPSEPMASQIPSINFKTKGVRLRPKQLMELKALTEELDKRRSRAIADEDWQSQLD